MTLKVGDLLFTGTFGRCPVKSEDRRETLEGHDLFAVNIK